MVHEKQVQYLFLLSIPLTISLCFQSLVGSVNYLRIGTSPTKAKIIIAGTDSQKGTCLDSFCQTACLVALAVHRNAFFVIGGDRDSLKFTTPPTAPILRKQLFPHHCYWFVNLEQDLIRFIQTAFTKHSAPPEEALVSAFTALHLHRHLYGKPYICPIALTLNCLYSLEEPSRPGCFFTEADNRGPTYDILDGLLAAMALRPMAPIDKIFEQLWVDFNSKQTFCVTSIKTLISLVADSCEEAQVVQQASVTTSPVRKKYCTDAQRLKRTLEEIQRDIYDSSKKSVDAPSFQKCVIQFLNAWKAYLENVATDYTDTVERILKLRSAFYDAFSRLVFEPIIDEILASDRKYVVALANTPHARAVATELETEYKYSFEPENATFPEGCAKQLLSLLIESPIQ